MTSTDVRFELPEDVARPSDGRGHVKARTAVAVARRILARNGCESDVGGHVSARVGNGFVISPFQYSEETKPEDVALVDAASELVEAPLPVAPARHFHAAIYEARPDVGAVIHTHSLWVAVVSTLDEPLAAFNNDVAAFHGRQALLREEAGRPTVSDGAIVAALGRDAQVLLLANHGSIVVAPTLEAATILAITLERCAQIHYWSRLAGGRPLPDPVVDYIASRKAEHSLQLLWGANVRRLRRSDPDLFA